MRQIAVIGSGPAGYYTAEACLRQFGDDVRVDIIDRMPVPFGLIRSGVAPDHQAIKAVSQRYEAIALTQSVRFVGNLSVGRDVSIAELLALYDAVVLATGAPADRTLGIEGDRLPGVIGSAAFVGWYNGHPDHAGLDPQIDGRDVVIVGNGNVALDVARILAKTPAEFGETDIVAHARERLTGAQVRSITLLGRRGPHQIAMSARELEELAGLARGAPLVDAQDLPPIGSDAVLDPAQRKSVGWLRRFAEGDGGKIDGGKIPIRFDFFCRPVRISGAGQAEQMTVESTLLGADGAAVGTGETYEIPASLIITCIGYRAPPIPDVPYDEQRGGFANVDGRIGKGLYCVGWARRGAVGTIGTNKPDGYKIAEEIAKDLPLVGEKQGRPGLDALIAARGIDIMTFQDWQKIDRMEIARAMGHSPREKFVHIEDMVAAAHH